VVLGRVTRILYSVKAVSPAIGRAVSLTYKRDLFELGRDRGKRAVERCSDASNGGQDSNRNTCRDQSVFNRRRRGLVSEKGFNHSGHGAILEAYNLIICKLIGECRSPLHEQA
jgi:hypothetical protein